MTRLPAFALLLALGVALAACDVTGAAAPESASAHTGKDLQYIGEPGANGP